MISFVVSSCWVWIITDLLLGRLYKRDYYLLKHQNRLDWYWLLTCACTCIYMYMHSVHEFSVVICELNTVLPTGLSLWLLTASCTIMFVSSTYMYIVHAVYMYVVKEVASFRGLVHWWAWYINECVKLGRPDQQDEMSWKLITISYSWSTFVNTYRTIKSRWKTKQVIIIMFWGFRH